MVVNASALLKAAPIKDMIPAKFIANKVSHGLGEAGYDIRIKQDVRFFYGSRIVVSQPDVMGGTYDPEESKGRFVLASSMEEFQMPKHLVGVVHDKSSWARRGLSVFNTVFEPGWKGFLTLELVYHGNDELHIPAGSGIAQVIFSTLAEPVAYEGKYQHQENRPVAAR